MAPSPVAEAFVLIRPDLTGFAAALQRELTEAVGKVKQPQVTVRARVVAQAQQGARSVVQSATDEAKATAATGFAALEAARSKALDAKASRDAAAASERSAAAKANEAAASKAAADAARIRLPLERQIARAQEQAARVTTAGVGAQTVLQKATLENTAARAALNAALAVNNAALKTNDAALIKNTSRMVADAEATEAQAAANVTAARAAQASAARLSQASRGAFATAASFAGLRGAVLASTGPFIAATIAVTAFGKAISAGADLEQNLNVFQATAGATADEMNRVSAAAVQLGKDVSLPGVSAGDAAQTMVELAKAGLSVEDSIEGARGVLLLATAANIDFSAASELAASALNSFGLAGDQAARVADVFAGAASAAQGSIQDFALANQQVDAVARQVGLGLEDTTAILAELAKNGLRGSDAGTSLRTALIRLIAPTTEARTLLDQLGVSIRDAQGNVDPLVFAKFGEATANLAPDLRDAITAAIFGQDAIRAVAIAAREGEEGFNAMRAAVSDAGKAQELADARSKGLRGATEALASNFETLGTTLSSVVIPALTELVTGLSTVVSFATDATKAVIGLGDTVADFAKKIPGVGAAGGFLKDFIGPAPLVGLRLGKKALDLFRDGEKEVSDEAREGAFNIQKFTDKVIAFFNATQAPTAGLQAAIDQTRKVNTLASQLQASIETFAETGFKDDAIRASILSLVDQLEAIGGPQTQAVIRANMQGIASVLGSELQALASDFGVTLEDLNQEVPQALRNVIQELSQSAEGQDILRKFGAQLSESLAEGIDDGSDKAVEAARKAVRRAADAVGEAQEAVKDQIERAGEELAAAVTSGRNNLRSIGDSLSQQAAELVNAGPIAQEAKKLQDALDKVEARLAAFRKNRQRDNLNDALTGAQSDLQRQRDQLVTLGQGLTQAQQSKISELLAPAQEKVKDATDDIKEFNLQAQSDALSGRIEIVSEQLEGRADAASKAVQGLVEQLRLGKINAQQFSDRITAQLAPQLKTLQGAAGKNLGLRFSTEFLNNLDTIVKQATALAGFVGIPSTSSVVNPADTRRAGNEAVADARGRVGETRTALAEAQANLDRTIKENASNAKTTASNTTRMVNLLDQINKSLAPVAPEKTVRTGGAKPDDNRSVKGSKVSGG